MTKGRQGNIDLGLAVIAAVSPPGKIWTYREIAEVCGCSVSAIVHWEKLAIGKLQKEAARRKIEKDGLA